MDYGKYMPSSFRAGILALLLGSLSLLAVEAKGGGGHHGGGHHGGGHHGGGHHGGGYYGHHDGHHNYHHGYHNGDWNGNWDRSSGWYGSEGGGGWYGGEQIWDPEQRLYYYINSNGVKVYLQGKP